MFTLSPVNGVFRTLVEVVAMNYKTALLEVRDPLLAIPYSYMPIFATSNRLKDYNITNLALGLFTYLMKVKDR